MTKGYDGQVQSACWKPRTSGWPLWAPLGRPRKPLILLHLTAKNHFSASRAPPEFSYPQFNKLMKITVFIAIVTPNGLLNLMMFSVFLQIPNYRKNKENMSYLFCTSISTVFSSRAPPMHMCFPLECSKKSIENAPVKTYGIQNTYLKHMK